jgi:hypothetical protein
MDSVDARVQYLCEVAFSTQKPFYYGNKRKQKMGIINDSLGHICLVILPGICAYKISIDGIARQFGIFFIQLVKFLLM